MNRKLLFTTVVGWIEPGCNYHCHCEERSDAAISWYDLPVCCAGIKMLPGVVLRAANQNRMIAGGNHTLIPATGLTALAMTR